jgi:hypothetical protein
MRFLIDTRPPAGAVCERRIVTRHVTFLLRHYDLPSLLAGKLHAAITRKYAKGRDWYDLLWYLSQRRSFSEGVSLVPVCTLNDRLTGIHFCLDWNRENDD